MEAQFCLSSRCPILKRLGVTVLRFHLNVQPFLGPLDPAVETEHVGGVGDAEDVLEDAAPAEQDVLPFPSAERAMPPPSFGDGRVVEVLADVFGRLG